MSAYCHCFNPEDAFFEQGETGNDGWDDVNSEDGLPRRGPIIPVQQPEDDAATESVDTFADLPPLVPVEAPPKPKPLFSAADTKEFIALYASKQRDRMTALYQHHLDDAINDLLEQRGDTLKEEMRAVIERADGVEQLSIVLFRYSKATVTRHRSGSYTDTDGNWWTSIYAYCDSLTTTLGGVDVDHIVRKTHFLKQLVARIGDPKHFIIKKQVHAPEEQDTHKVIYMSLWLEFWPKGVTDRRRRECEP